MDFGAKNCANSKRKPWNLFVQIHMYTFIFKKIFTMLVFYNCIFWHQLPEGYVCKHFIEIALVRYVTKVTTRKFLSQKKPFSGL